MCGLFTEMDTSFFSSSKNAVRFLGYPGSCSFGAGWWEGGVSLGLRPPGRQTNHSHRWSFEGKN
jgi:hypothetical protein